MFRFLIVNSPKTSAIMAVSLLVLFGAVPPLWLLLILFILRT